MDNAFTYLEHIACEKENIIRGLQLIQQREGYLSEAAMVACSNYFSVPLAEIEGVVTFYSQFRLVKPGKYQISICDGTACHIKGTPLILEWVSAELGIRNGETDGSGLFSLQTVACLGCCSLAPVLSVNGEVYGNLNRKSTLKILKKFKRQG